jgi:uncharacterized delta-60 repeat protein
MSAVLRAIVVVVFFVPRIVAAFPGDLVATFGTGGVVVDETTDHGLALAIQPDGAIVVVQEGQRLARYDANGNPDLSFGSGGSVTTTSEGAAVILQSDGMIVVAGRTGIQLTVERFDAGGTPDPLFGTGGVVMTPGPTPREVVLQSTGAIVAGGDTRLARFTAAGVLDATFGTGGTVDTSAEGSVMGLAVAADDALVTAGSKFQVGATVVRYDADGALDGGFGTGGVYSTESGLGFNRAAIQPDGNILATGVDGDQQLRTVRLTSAGVPDPTFGGGDGLVGSPFVDSITSGNAIAIQANGKIVTADFLAHTGPVMDPDTFDVGLTRVTATGELDIGFGNGGGVDSNLGYPELALAAAIDGDTLVVTGTTAAFGGGNLFLARYALGEICEVMPSCKGAAPKKATLQLADDANDAKDRLQWSYRNGDATTGAELGDPRVDDRYFVCLFDESGMTPQVLTDIIIPAGGTCDGKPCWRALATTGFKYQSKDGAAQGIGSLVLKSGAAGKTSITLKGRGAGLPTVALPPGLPLRLQLQATTGACWESTFSAAGVVKNGGGKFKGRSN